MKKYIKPSLKLLGLLRVVTQFSASGDPTPSSHADHPHVI